MDDTILNINFGVCWRTWYGEGNRKLLERIEQQKITSKKVDCLWRIVCAPNLVQKNEFCIFFSNNDKRLKLLSCRFLDRKIQVDSLNWRWFDVFLENNQRAFELDILPSAPCWPKTWKQPISILVCYVTQPNQRTEFVQSHKNIVSLLLEKVLVSAEQSTTTKPGRNEKKRFFVVSLFNKKLKETE